MLEHPPYSTDLPPCDGRPFRKMENVIKRTDFELIADIRARLTGLLKDLKTAAFQGLP